MQIGANGLPARQARGGRQPLNELQPATPKRVMKGVSWQSRAKTPLQVGRKSERGRGPPAGPCPARAAQEAEGAQGHGGLPRQARAHSGLPRAPGTFAGGLRGRCELAGVSFQSFPDSGVYLEKKNVVKHRGRGRPAHCPGLGTRSRPGRDWPCPRAFAQ